MPALLLLLATLLPLASFAVLLVMGRRLGNPLAGWLATAFIGASLALSLAGTVAWVNGGQLAGSSWGPGDAPIVLSAKWLPIGSVDYAQDHPGFLDVDLYIDGLTVAMFNLITLIALLVHFFSIRYMAADSGFSRFFTYLSLISFSMLGLLIGGSLLQIFIFWELTGICSYLLIAFWYDRPAAQIAGLRAILIDRIGGIAFLLGLAILLEHFGALSLPHMLRLISLGAAPISHATLTLACIAMVCAVITKSAQFPVHLWLTDAMEAPAPAAGFIVATTVGMGVYLIGRLYPLLTPEARLTIAIIGLLTLSIGALIALAQNDIKRLLAAVAMSQLGFILLAMGIGSWVGGLFHLMMFAFFQTLLFLAGASVIRAAGHTSDLAEMGGLLRKVPVTATTFAIGVLTIAGTPSLCGFASERSIFSSAAAFAALAAHHAYVPLARAFFIVPAAGAYLVAYSMMRCWMLIFWGKARNPRRFNLAHETAVLWFPLVVASVLCIIGGTRLLEARTLIVQSAVETQNYTARPGEPAQIGSAPPAWALDTTEQTSQPRSVAWAWAIGIGIAFLIYIRGYAIPRLLLFLPPVRMVRAWLRDRMYFDVIYLSIFGAVARGAARLVWAMDRFLLDAPVQRMSSAVLATSRAIASIDEHWLP
jgi:proton-translocating NADH-quinone oxidoreductase chain L